MALPDNLRPSRILDYEAPAFGPVVEALAPGNPSPPGFLQASHRWIVENVRPVYSLSEFQPTSVTLGKRRGSCSQRLALLESLSRLFGIPTRVEGFWIAGRFWYPRFRWTRWFMPGRILLAWPHFYVNRCWIGAETIFGDLEEMAEAGPDGFANSGESLFEALEHTAVDFAGITRGCAGEKCDLSGFVIESVGLFATRDELFLSVGSLENTMRGRGFQLFFRDREYL